MIKYRKIVKFLSLLRNKTWIHGMRNGAGAAIEHIPFLKTLELNCIIDIGANKGQFALVTRAIFPEAAIISFEPLPMPAKKFKKIFMNDGNTILHEVAIGLTAEEKTIHISKKDDSSSLLPISKEQSRLFPGTEEESTGTVFVTPLHDVVSISDIKKPALLKMDVQGFELTALEGCSKYLNLFEHIYVECSFVELYEGQALAYQIIEYLNKFGFRLSGVYNLSTDSKGRAIQADFYFRKL